MPINISPNSVISYFRNNLDFYDYSNEEKEIILEAIDWNDREFILRPAVISNFIKKNFVVLLADTEEYEGVYEDWSNGRNRDKILYMNQEGFIVSLKYYSEKFIAEVK